MVLVGLVSFALGAGVTWLLKPEPVFPSAQTSSASSVTTRADAPPDVSHFAPADAALTLANWNYDRQNWSHAIEH